MLSILLPNWQYFNGIKSNQFYVISEVVQFGFQLFDSRVT